MRVSGVENMLKHQTQKEGVDVRFGSPSEEYNNRYSECRHEMGVNRAITLMVESEGGAH
jgi:hypothetical protein